MKVIILAGGFGSRLSEYTKLIPKPMVKVNNCPLLIHIMKIYIKYNIKDFIIAAGYKSYVIKKYFKNFTKNGKNFVCKIGGKKCNVVIVDTGLKSLTGGRIKRASKYLNKYDKDFMFTYGDGVSEIIFQNYEDFINYITFLDTDDIWAKDKLQKQINFLRKNTEFKMIYSNYYIIDKYKKNKKLKFNSPLPSGKITDNLLKEYVIAILTVMVEKNIILKNKFNEKYEIIGDFDLFLKLSKNYKIGKIQKPLAFYRQHETNFSKKTKIYKDELNEWIVNNREKLTKSGHNLTYLKFYLFKLKLKNLIKLIFNLGV